MAEVVLDVATVLALARRFAPRIPVIGRIARIEIAGQRLRVTFDHSFVPILLHVQNDGNALSLDVTAPWGVGGLLRVVLMAVRLRLQTIGPAEITPTGIRLLLDQCLFPVHGRARKLTDIVSIESIRCPAEKAAVECRFTCP